MRIEWTPPVGRTNTRRDEKSGVPKEGQFASTLSSEGPAEPAGAAPSSGPVDGLLAIQELPDPIFGRRRAVQRGNNLLDRLEDLRLALLAGILPRGQLDGLQQLAKTARDSISDPRLAGVLDEIDLRVAVELAKLDAVA